MNTSHILVAADKSLEAFRLISDAVVFTQPLLAVTRQQAGAQFLNGFW